MKIDHKVTKRLIKLFCMTYRVSYRIMVLLNRVGDEITSGACALCYNNVEEGEDGWIPPNARVQENELHLLNDCNY